MRYFKYDAMDRGLEEDDQKDFDPNRLLRYVKQILHREKRRDKRRHERVGTIGSQEYQAGGRYRRAYRKDSGKTKIKRGRIPKAERSFWERTSILYGSFYDKYGFRQDAFESC